MSRDEYLANVLGQVDPAAYAGEGFSDTTEIPRVDDVLDNAWLRGRVGHEGEYWPGPKPRGKK